MIYRLMSGSALAAVLVLGMAGEIAETAPPCGKGPNPTQCPPSDPGPWPPACLGEPTPNFTLVSPDIPNVDPDTYSMFGRPLAAAQIQPTGDIVLAIGARTAKLLIYRLNPTDGTLQDPNPQVVDLDDNSQKLAVADLNADDEPDFVVAGFGDVEVLLSPDYVPEFLHSKADSIAATDAYIAVGVGGGKRDYGDVFIYDSSLTLVDTVSGSDVNSPKGGKFGKGVALGDVFGVDAMPDLIVGAPGVDGPSKKETNYGEARAFQDLSIGGGMFADGDAKNENLGWQAAVSGQEVFVATKWTGDDRRAEVYSSFPGSNHSVLRPGADSLGDGWASGGVGTGTINGAPAVIIGAPNANCAGEGSTGVVYLYTGWNPSGPNTPEVFVPHVEVDPNQETWNAFGWSADLISTSSGGEFVIIGEPGRLEGGNNHAGRVYVYQYSPPN